MAAIINRTPTGRLISLHSELRYLKERYRDKPFALNGLKYDAKHELNPLMFFPLAKEHPQFGIYDPYLRNPLNPAKFHLTQSIQYDTQKSKSASECLNALEALGWIKKNNGSSQITALGVKIADISYDDSRFYEISRSCVLGYGVFVGFLYKCLIKKSNDDVVNKTNIRIGYPDTNEVVEKNGINIPLSTGSQKDTIVRTRSTLFAWAITTGFVFPIELDTPKDELKWHLAALQEIRKKHWGWSKIKVFIPGDLFNKKHFVSHPLSYRWMTKSTKALRERGQESIRKNSLNLEEIVKNRRFAIVYALALASDAGKKINYPNLIDGLIAYEKLFVINKSEIKRVIDVEKEIAIVAGIPFVVDGDELEPLTTINMEVLLEGAPEEVVSAAQNIYRKSCL
jgi:hypothetical protein